MDALLTLDGQILLWIQEHVRNPILTAFFTRFTLLGDHGLLWIAVCLLLLIFRRTRKGGIIVMFSLLGSLLVNNILLKNLIARTRPYEVIESLQLLIAPQWDYSFPSGHAGSAFAAAMAMFLSLPKKFGIPALIVAALISFSRLYVGVHYPTDVLAGILTGVLIAVIVWKISDMLIKRHIVKS